LQTARSIWPRATAKTLISVRDIAEAAATAFQQTLLGTEYNLTGPEALDYAQAARIISGVSDRTVIYYDIPEEAMIEAAREQGMPESALRYLAMLYAGVREGRASRVTDDARLVTGKNPISFSQFARLHLAH